MKVGTASDRRRIGPGLVEHRRRQRRRLRPSLLALEDRRLLSTFTVTSTLDDGSPGTLRHEIGQANANPGDDTIDFDGGVFATPQTITLNGNQLELGDTSGATTITGPIGGVTVDGNDASRVFQIDGGVTASISGLTITGGSTGYFQSGGGVLNYGTATLINCTVSGNTARPDWFNPGGGLATGGYWGKDAATTLINCTISGNDGGGVNAAWGTTTLTNTIVAGQASGGDISGTVSGTNNLIGTGGSGGLVDGVDGNIVGVTDPGLAPLGDYGGTSPTMALLPGSPAIDAGTGAGAPATDQRGQPRAGAVDIGAFESQGFTLTPVAGTPQGSDIGTPFADPLVATVSAVNPLEPVDGGVVRFVAGRVGGATAILSAPSAVIAGGQAAITAAPNNALGGYEVVASVPGLSPVSFALTNTGTPFAALVVNTTSDSLFPGPGLLSLREAIGFANVDSLGISSITFDAGVFAAPQSITLTGTQLELSNTTETVTITGPAGGVTVSGGGLSRVFQVDPNVTASISGLTITGGNAGYDGGGGLINLGTTALINCTIGGNSTNGGGGGLATGSSSYPGATTSLTNCTVSGNSSFAELYASYGTTTLTNTIVAAVGGGFSIFGTVSGTNNLIGTGGSGGLIDGVDGNIVDVADPGLAPLGDYGGTSPTMALLPGSPAIDAGTGAGAPATDQRGYARAGAVDIGAFESQGFSLTLVAGTPQSSDIGTPFADPLAVSVAAVNPLEPVDGGVVRFVAGRVGGATAILLAPSAVIAGGQAETTAAPNNALGSYAVVASVPGLSPVSFALTNTGTPFAALVVNTTSDSLFPGPGLLSLREAIGFANVDSLGISSITFDESVFAGPRKLIALTGAQLELSNTTETVTITGPAAGLTVSGGAIELTTAGSDSGFPVSSSDLLQTNLSSSSVTGNIGDEEGLNTAADITALSNGQFGPAAPVNPPGPNPEVVLIHDGVEITYNLDTGMHPLGYDLTNINTYAGWGDSGRSQQDYTIYYSTVTDPDTFLELDAVFAPSYDGRPSDTAAFLSGSSGILASNVASIRFSFPSTQNGYVGYRELDVLGVPSTALVLPSGGPSRVFQVDAGVTASISGLTITGGSTGGNGAGLLNYGTTTLIGCTLSGNSANNGGGVFNAGTATLTDCTVSGNSASNGGGVFNGGRLTLVNSTLDGNTGGYGGGLYIGNGASATLTGCTVTGNSGGLINLGGTATLTDSTISGNGRGLNNGYGGTMTLAGCTLSGNFGFALINNGTATLTNSTFSGNAGYGLVNNGTATLTDCTVSGNSDRGVEARPGSTTTLTDSTVSGNSGSGLRIWYGGTATLTGCTISGNASNNQGGGVYVMGAATLTNCTISGNSALGNGNSPGGGGLAISRRGRVALTNCTISGNSALRRGGGGLFNDGGTATLANTIVAGNTADRSPDVIGDFASQGNNLIGKTDGSSGWVGSDLTGTIATPLNPLLTPLGNFGGPTLTMALFVGSPALDAGNIALIPAGITTDQRGRPRIINGTVDIGAFEAQTAIAPSFVVDTTADKVDFSDGRTSLREAIGSANAFAGNSVTFDPTVFASVQTITLSLGQLELSNTSGTETITAPAAGVTVDANNASRVFQVDPGVTASISGLTITGGKTGGKGGGLINFGTTTLTDCTLTGNTSGDNGGGLYNNFGTAITLTDCTISGNSAASDGGGLAGGDGGTVTLAGCTISGNSADSDGGGVYIKFGGTATLTGCTISGNSAARNGGGLYVNRATTTLTDCTVSGNSAARDGGGLFSSGTATLTGCTVSDNSADGRGGGVLNGGKLTLTGCFVSDNSADNGGGVSTTRGTTVLTDCTVSGNTAGSQGGGLYANNGGATTLTNSVVSGNSAYNGGGLFNYFGTATLTDCTVEANSAGHSGGGLINFGTSTLINTAVIGNLAGDWGGGMTNSSGTATWINCTVSGNSAGVVGGALNNNSTATFTNCDLSGNSAKWGGGVFNFYGTTTLSNSTVSGNSATYGGGVWSAAGTATLSSCTVSGNSAINGGGIANYDTTTLGNTIVAANTAGTGPDVSGDFSSLGNNLIGTTDGSSGWVGSDLTGTIATPLNPLLAPLGDYGGPTLTMALLPGSPAIDAGSNALIPDGVTTDQRGLPRIVSGVVDIGAFESSGFTIAVSSGDGQSTGVLTAFPNPLVATVTANNPAEPVAGGLVTFAPPWSGASATISGSPATIGGDGSASVTATANGITGSYAVTATAGGITTPASFGLTNLQLIIALDPSASAALSLSGNASINTAGIVYVNSSSSGALSASGNASVTAWAIDVHGRFVRSGHAGLNPTPVTGAPVLPVASLPSPSTSGMTNYGSLTLGGNSTRTIQPGIYTRISVSGNARLAMAPGIYVIEGGGFSASGFASVSGSGVMIVNAGSDYPAAGGSYGSISLGGNAAFNLSPASSGIYAGIALFQPSDNTKPISVTTNASGITGTIYAPAAALSESGNAALNASLIVKRLSISGNGVANGPSQAGPAIAGIRSNPAAASGGAAATFSSIGAVSVLDQAAPATIPIKLKIKLINAMGNNVGASSLPVVSMAAANSAGSLVPQGLPVGSPLDTPVAIDSASGAFRFGLKSKGSRLFI
ncbi:right-handed parallel beta-helix repeat-containing protein [Aquisphaera insulae]|uniref:right-handed parallel beta-helix repeat-containing protein n=1 Tax=Aquisphaera insulae TaxID=2712864 RepID=UPI0013EC9307|nr:right-handed parallel beta-helix repeat-containing protein [Aquisphaera insulae]